MAITAINPILKDTIVKNLQTAIPSMFGADIKIYSSEDADESAVVTPVQIKEYTIQQDFINCNTDGIKLTVTLTSKDYYTLFTHKDSLWCTIVSYPFIEEYRDIDFGYQNKPPYTEALPERSKYGWVHTYTAVFINPANLSSTGLINEIRTTENTDKTDRNQCDLIDIEFQLIDIATRNILKKSLSSGVLNRASISGAIKTLANIVGIKNIKIQEPDNNQIYNQIVISPGKQLFDVLYKLQTDITYGVYKEGFNAYFTNETLYIYPTYKVDYQENDKVINIYKAPENSFAGIFNYTGIDGYGNIHILSDTDIALEETGEASAESTGTHAIAYNAGTTLDVSRSVINTQGRFNSHNLISIFMKQENEDEENPKSNIRTVYVGDSCNPFELSSILLKDNKLSITTGIRNPVPYLIEPGQKCIYHYEDELGYKIRVGIVEGISYKYSLGTTVGRDRLYKGDGIIKLRLISDKDALVADKETNEQYEKELDSAVLHNVDEPWDYFGLEDITPYQIKPQQE